MLRAEQNALIQEVTVTVTDTLIPLSLSVCVEDDPTVFPTPPLLLLSILFPSPLYSGIMISTCLFVFPGQSAAVEHSEGRAGRFWLLAWLTASSGWLQNFCALRGWCNNNISLTHSLTAIFFVLADCLFFCLSVCLCAGLFRAGVQRLRHTGGPPRGCVSRLIS